jgi:hypothetical protein
MATPFSRRMAWSQIIGPEPLDRGTTLSLDLSSPVHLTSGPVDGALSRR